MSTIARTLNVSPSVVSRVLSGKTRSRKIERYISQLLGVRRVDIFPPSVQAGTRSQMLTCAA